MAVIHLQPDAQPVPAIVYKAGPAFLIEIAGGSGAALGGNAIPVEKVHVNIVRRVETVDEVGGIVRHCRDF